jgi:hypothetical protein
MNENRKEKAEEIKKTAAGKSKEKLITELLDWDMEKHKIGREGNEKGKGKENEEKAMRDANLILPVGLAPKWVIKGNLERI